MNVFDLMARIGLDTSEYDSGLDKSEGKFKNFGAGIKSGLKEVGSVTASAVGAVASGVTSMAKSIMSSTADLANYGDSIDKASQKIGISAKAYQEWEAVMQHSGTSMDSMTATFKTLANASQSATDDQAEAFKKLGMSMDDVSKMSAEDIFKNVITALQGMEEGTERAALANTLLGRGAMEMGALLNTSAEDTQKMIDEVNRLGGVMSDDAVKASAAFNDNLQDMNTAIDGVKRQITAEFLPGLSLLMKGFTSLISGGDNAKRQLIAAFARIGNGLKEAIEMVSNIARTLIPTIIKTALELLPQIGELAIDILQTLITTIVDNIPLLIDTAVTLIETLVDGITVALPQLVDAAIDIVLTLVDKLCEGDMLEKLIQAAVTLILALTEGLINAEEKIIKVLPQLVETIVNVLVDNAPLLIDAAIELIMMLAKGMVDKIPLVIEASLKITNAIYEAIVDLVTGASDWGGDMMDNFITGIKEKWEDLKRTVSDVAQSVKDLIGFSEPKKGPLSNFHTYAPDMMELFAKGIKDNTNKITGQLEVSLGGVKDGFTNGSYGARGTGNIYNITVAAGTISSDYDSYRAARLISENLAQFQSSQSIARGGIA